MAISLPPWLQISPDQFTQAAIAGGEQGYRAAAEAGSLAQRGLMDAAKLASEAAARAADIRVRREQINAELAKNAANVAAARYNAALDYNKSLNDFQLAREREANAVSQQGITNQLERDKFTAETELEQAKLAAGDTFAPSEDVRTVAAIDQFEKEGKTEQASLLRNILSKRGEFAPKNDTLTPDKQAELKTIGERMADINLKLSQPGKTLFSREEKAPDPDLLKQRQRLQARIDELLGASKAKTNAVASPALPALPSGQKLLDKETAAAILQEVGGDKAKARELARQRGYTF